ncbi:MAG: hypothetical protein KIT32_12335 [Rhodocyclaceae bacterium]|nr:hypothetical protein [Rhodocyclaceae bacterium]
MFTVLGGTISNKVVVDLTVDGFLPVSDEQIQTNIDNARGLGLKRLKPGPRVPLAIVGGGPSINNHVETLQNWQGDIWAINGAWGWCRDRGIDAVFCSVDPHPIVAKWARGADKAILATQCPAEAFEVLKGADVTVYDAGTEIKGVGGSTLGTSIYAGTITHHTGITLFGCESCYLPNKSHAYQHETRTREMIVNCGGDFYLTSPDYYTQARQIAELIRGLDGYIKEESGGILRAFVKNPEHWIAWLSEECAQTMRPINEPHRSFR